MWDAIVIGSGIAGLTTGAALARKGNRVLVLEQHRVPGGLTQTFRRHDWEFATGLHYLGGVGPEEGSAGQFGRLLAWLSDDELHFAPCDNPYDLIRLPGFELGIPHPEAAYRDLLVDRFSGEAAAIDRYFAACEQARRSAFVLFATRGMPSSLAFGLRLLRGGQLEHWVRRTLAEQLAEIRDPRLRAVLAARWGDYGAPPMSAPFVEHALVTGSYNAGAFYPIGGPARFAQALGDVIRAAGGELRTSAPVRRILVEGERAVGVVHGAADGEREERAPWIVSAAGVHNTIACLPAQAAAAWQQEIGALQPGLSYVSLYLGFEGDVRAAGASTANTWIYESEDVGRVWRQPGEEPAPGLFVSFTSLKNPAHVGPHSAEVLALVDPAPFADWIRLPPERLPESYRAFKARVEETLVAQFLRHFPRLQPHLRYHETSTPVTQRRFVWSPQGAMYGVEMSADRMLTPALKTRTPIDRLLLAGQDVGSPGIQGAAMTGMMAAARLDPSIWLHADG